MVIIFGYCLLNYSIEKCKVKFGIYVKGIVVDIYVMGLDKYRLVKFVFECGFIGIGIDKSFVYLDCSCECCVIWGY